MGTVGGVLAMKLRRSPSVNGALFAPRRENRIKDIIIYRWGTGLFSSMIVSHRSTPSISRRTLAIAKQLNFQNSKNRSKKVYVCNAFSF